VEKGSVYGFLGTNGAGKTTTLRLLMGLLVPTAGHATIAGLDIQKDRLEVKRRVGYLPDAPVFPSFLRGAEVLQMAAELHGQSRTAAQRRAQELMEWTGLKEESNGYPEEYSIGMKKRLGLACALVHDPDVLLLDEPTNGLDPYAVKMIRDWILEQAGRGKTIVLSTHRLDFAERICTHLGVIHRGTLLAQGELNEIREKVQAPHLEDIFFALTAPEGDTHA
jgi:ABC-2 type transport system ATP-binding protein